MKASNWASGLLAAVAMVALAASASAQTDHEKQLYDAAKAEGSMTWYSGVLDQPICDEVGKAFTAKYPGIQVNAIKTTSQVAFQRVLQDLKAGQVQSDVFTTTDIGHMVFLKSKGELVQYVPDAEAQTVSEQIGRMPEGRMLLMAGLMLADKAAGLEDRLRDAEARLAEAQAEAARRPETVEVPVEVPVEVRIEVTVIPAEVRQLFADVAEETEALAHAVASLVPPERAA